MYLNDFYNDATVLVTGGTGFMGKVLVEKLVRCLNVKTVILPVRTKNDKTIDDRLFEFMRESIFDRLNKERPNALQNALKFIDVDYSKDDLGFNASDLRDLIENVHIVFNMVASVKFNEKLKNAINVNILATKGLLTVVKQMKTLKAFVHVSTIFSQLHRDHFDEDVVKGPINCEKLLCMNECLDSADLDMLETSILQTMPNTYTFTKRLAEELVVSELKSVPSAIFRPPIVMSTYKEPFPGWTDNHNGPTAMWMGMTRGLIHCVNADGSTPANIMPVDYCINALVAVAWEVSQEHRRSTEESIVYNYLYENPTWRQHVNMLLTYGLHEPLANPIWHFFFFVIRNRLVYQTVFFLCHMIPGYLMDALATLKRRKSHFVRDYQKLHRMIDHVRFSSFRSWTFDNQNMVALSEKLAASGEAGSLDFDGSQIDWVKYYESFISGIKRHYLKESVDKIEHLKSRYKWLKMLHYTIIFAVLAVFVSMVVQLAWF